MIVFFLCLNMKISGEYISRKENVRRDIIMNTDTNISAKEIWLTYFNDILFEKGVISEKEKNKMSNLIYQKCRGANSGK